MDLAVRPRGLSDVQVQRFLSYLAARPSVGASWLLRIPRPGLFPPEAHPLNVIHVNLGPEPQGDWAVPQRERDPDLPVGVCCTDPPLARPPSLLKAY